MDLLGSWLLVTSDFDEIVLGPRKLRWVELSDCWVDVVGKCLEDADDTILDILAFQRPVRLAYAHAAMPWGPTVASSKVALALHLLAKRLWSFILRIPSRSLRSRKPDLTTVV